MDIDWENYGRNRQGRTEQQSAAYHSRAHTYVDGNTVRKTRTAPKRRERIEPKKEPKKYPQRQPVRMPGISARGFVFLTTMTAIVMVTGFCCLSAQSEVKRQKAQLISLQTETIELKEDNAEAYQKIEDSVDISKIYKRATKKLKMVQAETNQIYTYNNKKSDMVKQYADIPGTGE